MSNKAIYADNAAATPLAPEAAKAMAAAALLEGNPSAFNDAGRAAAALLEKCRKETAAFLRAKPDEIIFAASGSEANSLAIRGMAAACGIKGKRIITSPTEHHSVLANFRQLASEGAEAKYLKVDEAGGIDTKGLAGLLNSKTVLVSLMYANNEIGTIHRIADAAKVIRQYREKKNLKFPYFHVDACQAAGYLDMDVNRLGADLLTFNGSKIYGPRGSAVLYVRRGTEIRPQVLGGGQEQGLRAGTENLPAIAGLAAATGLINIKDAGRLAGLRDYFIGAIQKDFPGFKINGPAGRDRLPGNVNVSVPGLSSEYILLELDRLGVRAGSGSACTARSVEPSHVLKAIGVSARYINGAIRFSFGRNTSKKDADRMLTALKSAINKLEKRFS